VVLVIHVRALMSLVQATPSSKGAERDHPLLRELAELPLRGERDLQREAGDHGADEGAPREEVVPVRGAFLQREERPTHRRPKRCRLPARPARPPAHTRQHVH
jgi:hypothetical protein